MKTFNSLSKMAFWAAAFALLILSCNIFSPLSIEPTSADAKIVEAKKEMENREYGEAIILLTDVIAKDSTRSEAYYLRGKCYLRQQGVDLISIWAEISPKNPNSVPFLYQPGTVQINSRGDTLRDSNGNPLLYRPLSASADSGRTVLDSIFLRVANLHSACKKAFRDLAKIEGNIKDGTSDGAVQPIMYRLDYGIESFLTVTLELLADYDKDGWVSSEEDKRMYGMWCNPDYADFSDIKHIEIDSIKTLTSNPNKINEAIDSTLSRINGATMPSIDSMKEEFNRAANMDLDIDTTILNGFEDFAVNIRDNITFYRYNDTVDNDGNWANDGKQDRMIWIDYDQDGLIDVLQSDSGWFNHKYMQQGIHIGDSLHWRTQSALYDTVDTNSGNFYVFKPEKSTDSITMIHFKRYKGGPAGEWLRGDWSVDEEKMDGKDNDQDGRIDEDTHIVEDTLDDDGDWWDTNGNGIRDVMIWYDTTQDGRVDVGTGKISLRNGLAADPARYIRLDPATYMSRTDLRPYWPMVNGNPVYNGKSTYIGSYSGEFKSGDFGIDEEMFDGFDNDDDGRADEDASHILPTATVTYLP